jgi:hypothetical protein
MISPWQGIGDKLSRVSPVLEYALDRRADRIWALISSLVSGKLGIRVDENEGSRIFQSLSL